MVFVLTAVQTMLGHTVAHILQDNYASDNYKNEQVVLKAIPFTNKATTCTHLRRPSLNINTNGSQCTHTVTDRDLTRNT
jgi:hypothetical protein